MNIEWFRDLVISIFGVGATLVIIFIGVLAFLFYRKLKPILNSVKSVTKTVENISSCVEEEVSRPLARLAAFVQGISQAISLVGKFSKRK
ncbi:MAG TPA: hypothetical protein VMW00_06125 [Dehalococcoidales bacterium]|nr:hypothetical protein [Dehalococcoidales bacterium]